MRFVGVQHVNDLQYGEKIGETILEGLGVNSIVEARKLPWERILQYQTDHPDLLLWPIIDGYHIPQNLDLTIKSGKYNDIPVIIGMTAEEGIALGNTLQKNISDPKTFEKELKNIYGDFAEKYLAFNGFDECPEYVMNPALVWEEFNAGTIAWCEESICKKQQPIYLYLFTRDVPGKNGGAGHFMDLWYSFGNLQFSSHPKELVDYVLENAMNTYFGNFIKTGNPNGETLPEWKSYTRFNRSAMELGDHIGMISNICSPRIQLLVDYILDDGI